MNGGTLILRGGAVGDFIVLLPLLEALRERFPGERLAVAAAPQLGALAMAAGLADEARDLGRRDFATLFQDGAPPEAALVAWLRSFERIVSFLHDPQGAVARAFGRPVIAGLPKPLDGAGKAGEQMIASVRRALDLPDIDLASYRLRLPCEVHDSAEATLVTGRWWTVHPGSGSARKNWPAERWGELLGRLLTRDHHVRIALLGGEADDAPMGVLRLILPPERIRVFAHRPLVEVAGLLAASECYLGHDSGLGHLAAALGLPTFQIFGPSDASVWAPPQPRAFVLRAPAGETSRLTVDQAITAWKRFARDLGVCRA